MELFRLFLPSSSAGPVTHTLTHFSAVPPRDKNRKSRDATFCERAPQRLQSSPPPSFLLLLPCARARELACLLSKHSWNFLRNKPRQPSAPKPKLVVGMSGVLFACEGFSGGDGDRSTWQAHHSLHLLRHSLRKEESARHGALS